MKRQFTFSQYRTIDLALFAGMLLLFEFLIVTAATKWFPAQPYIVSVVGAVAAIVMMRWGPFGAIHAVLGGAIFCLMSGAGAEDYIIYCAGNLLSLLSLLLIRWFGEAQIRQKPLLAMLYAFTTQLLMQVGRMLVAFVLGHPFINCVGFITTDVLSWIFTMVIIWIVRNVDGLFENQKSYLLRLQKEREKERGEQF